MVVGQEQSNQTLRPITREYMKNSEEIERERLPIDKTSEDVILRAMRIHEVIVDSHINYTSPEERLDGVTKESD